MWQILTFECPIQDREILGLYGVIMGIEQKLQPCKIIIRESEIEKYLAQKEKNTCSDLIQDQSTNLLQILQKCGCWHQSVRFVFAAKLQLSLIKSLHPPPHWATTFRASRGRNLWVFWTRHRTLRAWHDSFLSVLLGNAARLHILTLYERL